MLKGVHAFFGFTSFLSSMENHQAQKLVNLVFIEIGASSTDGVHMKCAHVRSVCTPMLECLGTPMPHACHARTHTQQHMWQAALPIQCATAELRTCEQGCIKQEGKHPRRLTWPSWIVHRTPLNLWLLVLALLVMLQSSDAQLHGKNPWANPCYAHLPRRLQTPFRQILTFSG